MRPSLNIENSASTSFCRRKDERPGEILKAALEEFTLNGFAATRLEDVAKRAGICKGTIYLYFKSKEELFAEVVRDRILPHYEKLEALSDQPDSSAKDIVRELFRTLYKDVLTTDTKFIPKLIISEGTRFPDLAKFYFEEIITRFHEVMSKVIKHGVEAGEFRESALHWEPQAIFAPVVTAAIWKTVFEQFETLDLDAYMQTHIDLLLHGLEKQE